jgi:hypothetical protein
MLRKTHRNAPVAIGRCDLEQFRNVLFHSSAVGGPLGRRPSSNACAWRIGHSQVVRDWAPSGVSFSAKDTLCQLSCRAMPADSERFA